MQYYYNYEALADFTDSDMDYTSGIWWQFVALSLCSISGFGGKAGCYDNAWARITMNGGNPEIEKQGAYAVYDLWSWRGMIQALVFYFIHEAIRDILFATVAGIALAMLYALSSGLPLCVEGDIMWDLTFSDEAIDVCKVLGLETSTLDLRQLQFLQDEKDMNQA